MQPTNRRVKMRNQPLRMRDLLRRLQEIHSSIDYISFDLLHQEEHCIARFLVRDIQYSRREGCGICRLYLFVPNPLAAHMLWTCHCNIWWGSLLVGSRDIRSNTHIHIVGAPWFPFCHIAHSWGQASFVIWKLCYLSRSSCWGFERQFLGFWKW